MFFLNVTLATEIFTPSRNLQNIYRPSNKGKEQAGAELGQAQILFDLV